MKRELLQNVKVAPYENGDVIDRENLLSMVFAAKITTAGALTLSVTDSDTASGTYEAVNDTRIAPNEGIITNGVISFAAKLGDIINVDIDLLGCKRYVIITASGAAAADVELAYAIGDAGYAPV